MRFRTAAFLICAAVIFACYGSAVLLLPAFGNFHGRYGETLNAITMYERHATNVVTTVVFDYRGFDTVGEEFMLFGSVVGVMVLFRSMETPKPEQSRGESDENQTDAVRVFVLGLVDVLALFSMYILLTGHLSPGGGFQGGVMLATAILLIYLSGGMKIFMRLTPKEMLELSEAAGVGGLVLYGVSVLGLGMPFLQNALPLGTTGRILSAGSIPLLNLLTGMAVTMGIVLLLQAFLREALETAEKKK